MSGGGKFLVYDLVPSERTDVPIPNLGADFIDEENYNEYAPGPGLNSFVVLPF